MKIEQANEEEIRVTPESELDLVFWTNIKAKLNTYETQIESLKKENKKLKRELSYHTKDKH